jgi:serine/threonine protein kinase
MEDLTGKQLGQYRIIAPLGEGGMAAVYKAYQPNMDRYVALKILPRHLADGPEFAGRFEQEAKVIAQLQHPHILPVHDYGESDGYTYIVMPFVKTGTLADLLHGKPLELNLIKKMISQVGDALDYAHSRGVIHRDVKPSNILIDERGNCLLTDFGIAKMVEGNSQFTQTGRLMGTPAYMSPEQGMGQGLDARSDIYSLGVIFYEMATGRQPFSAETPIAIILKHINDPLPPPRSINPGLPESVERIILKALAKSREDRYSAAGDLVNALQIYNADQKVLDSAKTIVEPVIKPGAATALTSPARPIWKRKGVLGAGGLVALLVLSLAIWQVIERQGLSTKQESASSTLINTSSAADLVNTEAAKTAEAQFTQAANILPAITETPIPEPTLTSTPRDTWQQGKLVFVVGVNWDTAIYVLDLANQVEPRLLYTPGEKTLVAAPSWSPEGNQIAFYQFEGGDKFTYVIEDRPDAFAEQLNACVNPSWSSDGTQIICKSNSSAAFDIVNLSTRSLFFQLRMGAGATLPNWSPQNDEIVYVVSSDDKTAIWRTGISNGALPSLLASASSENYAPAWSPDGQWIAYQSNQGSPLSDLWIMDRSGGNLKRVLHTDSQYWSRAPSWSPDGHWLAFVSNQAGSIGADFGEIFVVSLNTGEVHQVTNTGGKVYDWRVSWGK